MSALPAFVPPLAQWLLYAVTTGMLGVAVFYWGVLVPLGRERGFALIAFPALRRAWAFGWGVTIVGLLILPLRFGIRAIELFGDDAVTRSRGMLAGWWGAGLLVQHAATALFGVGLHVAGPEGRRRGWVMLGIAAALAALVPPLSGHAALAGPIGRWAVLNDALHVGAAGAWVGGLALILVVGLPAAIEADVPRELSGGLSAPALVLARFSRMALFAVAVLACTGTVNARVQVGSWAALVDSGYGRTLLLKLGLVLPAALLGLWHWRRVLPGIRRDLDPRRLRPTAAGELALGLVVLAVTAVLALTPTPGTTRVEQEAAGAVPVRP